MPKIEIGKELFESLTLAARIDDLLPHLSQPVKRVPTGFALLDAALAEPGQTSGGFVCPSTVVVGAPPKAGKSIWGQILAQAWVQRGLHALYWDLENGAFRFAQRLGWRLAKIASRELAAGLTDIEQKRFDKMVRWFRQAGKRFAYQPAYDATPEDVAGWCSSAELVADGEPWLFVVDSLQKLPPIDRLDRRQSVDTWMRFFEHLKQDLHCVVLIISELSRASYEQKGKAKAAYKESGDIEYTCDLGMTFRPVSNGEPAAWLDLEWDRDGHRQEARIGKYIRVLPYYEIIEEAPRKKI